MFKSELQKLINKRLIILLIIIIMANIIVTYMSCQKQPAKASEVDKYIELYENDYEEFNKRYNTYMETSYDTTIESISYTSKEDYCLNVVKELHDYICQYNSDITSILFQADVNISESLPKTFSYNYQLQVKNMYESLPQNNLPMIYVSGWDSYILNNQQCLLILIAIILISSFIIVNDYDVGMNKLIQTTAKGKVKITINKIFVDILMVVIITMIVSGTTVISTAFSNGLSGENAPIQLLSAFEFCPFNISVLQYALIQLAVRIVGFVSIGVFTMLLSFLFKSYIVSAISVLSVATINNLIASTQLESKSCMALFNQWLLIDANSLFAKFQCCRVFKYPIYLIPAMLISLLIITALCAIIIIFHKEWLLYGKSQALTNNKIQTVRRKIHAKIGCRYSFQFELKKIFFSFIVVILSIFSLFMKGYITIYSVPERKDSVYQMYAELFEGEMTSEKENQIEEIRNSIDNILASKQSVIDKYKNGEITDTEYREYMKQYWENYVLEEGFGEIEAYANALTKYNLNGWIIYDTGYNIFFNLQPDVFLCTLIFIISHGIFYNEKKSKMNQLNNTTIKGKKYLYKKKIQCILSLTFIVTLLFTLIDMVTIIKKYSFPSLEAPVQSLRIFGNVEFNLTIWQFLTLFIILKIIFYMGFSLLVALIGLKANSNTTIVVLTLLIILLPHSLSNFLPLFCYFDILNYLSVTQIITCTSWNNGLLISIPCIFLVGILLAVIWGRKAFITVEVKA